MPFTWPILPINQAHSKAILHLIVVKELLINEAFYGSTAGSDAAFLDNSNDCRCSLSFLTER